MIAAFLAAGHVLGVLKHSEKEYQKTIAELEAFLNDETNQAADESAEKLGDQVKKQDNMIFDMENAKANIYSYPLVTSDVFKTLEDCCPDKVLITITGYNQQGGRSCSLTQWHQKLPMFQKLLRSGRHLIFSRASILQDIRRIRHRMVIP